MTNDPLASLVAELSRLPGIGRKTATRLAHHLLKVSAEDAAALAEAIVDVKEKLFHCSRCNSITAIEPCDICTDPRRDQTRICVVEEPFNIQPIERTGEYRGLYHVLGGKLSPLDGIGPEQLNISELLARLRDGVREVIVATNPSVEGEATAVYIARLLQPTEVPVTRLAQGLPAGADLEYTDELTLRRAMEGRRTY